MRRRHVTHKAPGLDCSRVFPPIRNRYPCVLCAEGATSAETGRNSQLETRVSSDGSEPRVGSRKMNDDDKREIRRETEKRRLIFVKFYIFGYFRYSRDNWDFQVEEEDCESTGINTYLTKLINRQGNWIEIYYESFHELAPVASGAEGEDTGDPCLRSRSCIYTGWVIHGLHGTVTPVRSINILRAVIPQHPQPSPPFMPRIRTYTVGSACIPSHVRRCIIFPRHAVVSAHAKAAEPGTGNVGHVYTTSPLPLCVQRLEPRHA